jgi:hypothetical protein
MKILNGIGQVSRWGSLMLLRSQYWSSIDGDWEREGSLIIAADAAMNR